MNAMMMLGWDAGVHRGRLGGRGRGGIEAISATSQTENDLYLTKTETRRLE
jgi:hypothetical protein